MSGGSQAKAARSRLVVSYLLFERLTDQFGHRRTAFGCQLAQASDEVLGCDNRGAMHDIIMTHLP